MKKEGRDDNYRGDARMSTTAELKETTNDSTRGWNAASTQSVIFKLQSSYLNNSCNYCLTMKRVASSNVTEKVKAIFFRSPTTKVHLRELARRAKVSAPAATKACETLIAKGLLRKTETPPTITYEAIHEEKSFRDEKRIWNLRTINESRVIEHLARTATPDAIILFGSFSKGEDWENSDIDIALVNPRKDTSVTHYEELLGKEIQLVSLKKPFPKDLTNNIINGIVLYGRWDPL